MQATQVKDDGFRTEVNAFTFGFIFLSILCAYKAPVTLSMLLIAGALILVAFYRISRNYDLQEIGLSKKTFLRDYFFNIAYPLGIMYSVSLAIIAPMNLLIAAIVAALMWLVIRKLMGR